MLVEKPLAVEVREADAMIAAADDAGRLLGVCFQQRFRPVIAAARGLIAAGRLGELSRLSIVDPLYRPNSYYGTAGWRGTWEGEGGGVLMNQAPHTLDLLCHLAGPPATVVGEGPAAVAADGGRGHGHRTPRMGERRRRHAGGVDDGTGRAAHRAGRRLRAHRDRR